MPRAPKQCARCGALVRARTYCDDCAQARQWQGAGHGSTRAQQRIREQVLAEEPVCACGAPATEAGHLVARSLGGGYERGNLTGQCRPCNLAQMIRDRADVGAWEPAPPPF